MKEFDDRELTQFIAFLSGDESAFNLYFDKFYNRVLSFCIQFLHDKEEAKNATQEIFLKLWLEKNKIKTENGIQAFLYTYAKSICINLIRHNKVKNRYVNEQLNKKERQLDIEILQSLDFNTLELLELTEMIDDIIADLPAKTKIVYLKKRFENKKNQQPFWGYWFLWLLSFMS